jgi:CheY-like chemotaxis protein
MQLSTVASLATAAAKNRNDPVDSDIAGIVEAVQHVGPRTASSPNGWRNQILWVDDRPDNNIDERRAFEALGLEFKLALSTDEAFGKLAAHKFAAIISDMGRREGPREGYVLLDEIRRRRDATPLFFYASASAPEHKRETAEHGGQDAPTMPRSCFYWLRARSLRLEPAASLINSGLQRTRLAFAAPAQLKALRSRCRHLGPDLL